MPVQTLESKHNLSIDGLYFVTETKICPAATINSWFLLWVKM